MPPERARTEGSGALYRRAGQLTYSGIDLVPVQDLAERLAAQPGLTEELFTAREISYCRGRTRRRAEHFAARFAAKEAVLKALGTGTGTGNGIAWTDIEVAKQVSGRPYIRLHGNAECRARSRGVRSIDVSLSHAGGLSIACAVVVCEGDDSDDDPDRQGADGSKTQPKPVQEVQR